MQQFDLLANEQVEQIHETSIQILTQIGVEFGYPPALEILKNLKAIHFCGFILSFSFWNLIGLLVYLLFNISNFFRFKRWEQIYFVSAALLFLIMAIVIPNTYGKYRFEFGIQEVRPIAMGTKAIQMNHEGTEWQLNTMIENGAVLYTLGPTRDKEVIIAATH